MIKNKFHQEVYTIEELDDMGLPRNTPYDEDYVIRKITPEKKVRK